MATDLGYEFSPEALKRIREEKDVSQGKLSRAVGCSSSAISQYENGRSIPSISMMMAIAEVLNTDVVLFVRKTA